VVVGTSTLESSFEGVAEGSGAGVSLSPAGVIAGISSAKIDCNLVNVDFWLSFNDML
jgi:hypothetical protein